MHRADPLELRPGEDGVIFFAHDAATTPRFEQRLCALQNALPDADKPDETAETAEASLRVLLRLAAGHALTVAGAARTALPAWSDAALVRLETEWPGHVALSLLQGLKNPTVLDLGTGCGNLALEVQRGQGESAFRGLRAPLVSTPAFEPALSVSDAAGDFRVVMARLAPL